MPPGANRRQGPFAKLIGVLAGVAGLAGFAGVHYAAFTNPGGWRGSGGDPRIVLLIFDAVLIGLVYMSYRFVRKHERAMRDAGFEPSEVAETYWEAYALRAKAEAERRGGDVRRHLHEDITKRLVGLAPAQVLSPAEIQAAVRQAAPVPGAPPPGELLGTWTNPPETGARPGWTAQVDLRETAGSHRARLWFWAPAGVHDAGESEASVREGFVEVKREDAGEMRVLRLTAGTVPDSVDVNEYRFPSGRPNKMQVNTCVLRRIRA